MNSYYDDCPICFDLSEIKKLSKNEYDFLVKIMSINFSAFMVTAETHGLIINDSKSHKRLKKINDLLESKE